MMTLQGVFGVLCLLSMAVLIGLLLWEGTRRD